MCNPVNPLVYGVYLNKRAAVKYAEHLVKYRFERAEQNKHEFGYYHFITEDKKIKETKFDCREKIIFSACLKIKDGLEYSDDGCFIQVIRRNVSK